MKDWAFLFIAILSETAGTTALKASDNFTRFWPTVIMILGYAVGFFFLAKTLKTIPVGISYAVWSGVGIVLIALAGWILFDQKLDPPAMIGIGLILTGVIVLNVFSSAAGH